MAAPAKPCRRRFTYRPVAADGQPREIFVAWGEAQRNEDPKYLGERFDRFGALVRNEDLWDDRNKRAFLLTPREIRAARPICRALYDHAFLDIGFGVTISGPHIVGRMTNTIDVKKGEKVLEIGTGSGYQSAYLSHLTDKVFTIEIIKPLAERTRATYDELIDAGYNEFKAIISSKNADLAYYGWEEAGARSEPRSSSPAASTIFRLPQAAAAQAQRHYGHSGQDRQAPSACSRSSRPRP